VDGTDLKIVAGWRYDWCTNARENFQNLRKWVQSLCALLWPFRSKIKEKFYNSLFTPCIVVHPYKKYFATLLQGATKTVKFVEVVPITADSATFCVHRNAIRLCRAILKMTLGLFIVDDSCCVPCSNFYLCRQMAPLKSAKF